MKKARPWVSSILALLGLVSIPLAVYAQNRMDRRLGADQTSWLFFGLAAAMFLGAFCRRSVCTELRPTALPARGDRPLGWAMAFVGLLVSLGSYAFFGDNRLSLLGVLMWQGGLLVFVWGAVGWGDSWSGLGDRLRRWYAKWPSPWFLGVLLVTLVGLVFRLKEIADLPGEPGVDLPLIMMNIQKVLDGEWPIFFTLHPGREGLYIYLATAYVRLFGISYPALRTFGALIGTVTIPVIYLVGKQLFSREVGLVAAGLLAVSRWHVILSRTGLRFVLMPLFSLLLLAALQRALKGRRPIDWVLVGLIMGWGFHTYNAWLIMPAAVVGGWFFHCWMQRDWSWERVWHLSLALSVAAMLSVPLARFAHDDPEMFSLRVASRLVNQENPLPPDLLQTLGENMARTAGMFNWTGDGVAHINVPLKRQLGLISGALFIPGLAFLLLKWRQGFLLLLALAISSLPSALSIAFPQEVPNAGRSSGAVGFACLVAAIPLVVWMGQLRSMPSRGPGWRPLRLAAQAILVAVTIIALVAEAGETRTDYFERYRFSLAGGNYPVSTQIVRIIGQFSQEGEVFLKGYPHWYDGNAVRTQLKLAGIEWANELLEIRADLPPQTDTEGPLVVILHPRDVEAINALEIAFPTAVTFTLFDNHGVPVILTLIAER